MQEKIQELQALCAAYFQAHPEAEKTKIQLLYIAEDEEGELIEDEHNGLSYYAGEPPYIEDWPYMEDTPMQHMLTLDLRALPQLNKQFISLFVAEPFENEAYEPYNPDTFLYYHSGQVRDEEQDAPIEPVDEQRPIAMFPIEVPTEAFLNEEEVEEAEDWDGEDFELSEELKAIQLAIFNCSYIGGKPIWLQSKDYEGPFIGQFDMELVPEINLGDSGIMYIFEETAFWQCY